MLQVLYDLPWIKFGTHLNEATWLILGSILYLLSFILEVLLLFVLCYIIQDFLVGVILQAGLDLLSFTKEYESIPVQCGYQTVTKEHCHRED